MNITRLTLLDSLFCEKFLFPHLFGQKHEKMWGQYVQTSFLMCFHNYPLDNDTTQYSIMQLFWAGFGRLEV